VPNIQVPIGSVIQAYDDSEVMTTPGKIGIYYNVLNAIGLRLYNGTSWVAIGGSGGNVDSVSNLDGTLTISPTTGAVHAAIATNGVKTVNIANSNVTYAKIQNVSANSVLLGSSATGGGAPPSEITLGTNLSMAGSVLNATGGGGGSTPGGVTNDIQTNSGSSTFAGSTTGSGNSFQYNGAAGVGTITENYANATPGINFGSYLTPSVGSTLAATYQINEIGINGQSNYGFFNMFTLHKNSNGDTNIFNINTAFNGADPDFNAEGYVPIRNQHSIAETSFVGVVTSHAPVTGGNSLGFSGVAGGGPGAGRPVIDLTDDVQTVSITSTTGGGSNPNFYTIATVSGSPFTVSTHGTVFADVLITPNVNNTPTLATATLSLASGCTVNSLITFGGAFIETAKIQSIGTSGGHQTITANLRITHPAGTEYWCGGWAGRFADIPALEINNTKLMFYVLGTPANNQIAIARQITAGTDGAFVENGTWNIYHGGIVIDPHNVGGTISPIFSINVMSDNDAAWTLNSQAEVTNGLYVEYDFWKDYTPLDNNPYALGNTFDLVSCYNGNPACGGLTPNFQGGNAIFHMDNMNPANKYVEGGCGGANCWHIKPFINLGGTFGNLAIMYQAPINATLEYVNTAANGFNIVQIDDTTAFLGWSHASSLWTYSGPNFLFGAGAGGAANTHIALNGDFSFNESTSVPTPTAGKDLLYGDSVAHCLMYAPNGASPACLNTGGSGGMVYPPTGIALSSGSAWLASPLTVSGGAVVSTDPLTINGAANGMDLPPIALPSPVATDGGVFVDPSGNIYISENGGAFSRVCDAANGACGSGGISNATTTVGTSAVAANSCNGAVTVTMTGLASTAALNFTPNADVSGITGWGPGTPGLYIITWPTTNTANYKVCNSSGSSITPGSSVTFNISARQ
jgi:hypothetical protein